MKHLNKFFLVVSLMSSGLGFAMQQQAIAHAALLAQIRYQHLHDAGIIIEPTADQSARVYPKKRQPHYATKQRNQPHSMKLRSFSQSHK